MLIEVVIFCWKIACRKSETFSLKIRIDKRTAFFPLNFLPNVKPLTKTMQFWQYCHKYSAKIPTSSVQIRKNFSPFSQSLLSRIILLWTGERTFWQHCQTFSSQFVKLALKIRPTSRNGFLSKKNILPQNVSLDRRKTFWEHRWKKSLKNLQRNCSKSEKNGFCYK